MKYEKKIMVARRIKQSPNELNRGIKPVEKPEAVNATVWKYLMKSFRSTTSNEYENV
jgi:hypothetical protein